MKEVLPAFKGETISRGDDLIFMALKPNETNVRIHYKGEMLSLTGLDSILDGRSLLNVPSILLFIDKNEKMNRVFQLEHEIRKRRLSNVFYVSSASEFNKENIFHGIGRRLPISNQSGTVTIENSFLPPVPLIEYELISMYPLFELKEDGIWLNGKTIQKDEITPTIIEAVNKTPDFFPLYHIDPNITYGEFTSFLSKQNEAYSIERNSWSLKIHGKKYDELSEVEKNIIRNKTPLFSLRISDFKLKLIKKILDKTSGNMGSERN